MDPNTLSTLLRL